MMCCSTELKILIFTIVPLVGLLAYLMSFDLLSLKKNNGDTFKEIEKEKEIIRNDRLRDYYETKMIMAEEELKRNKRYSEIYYGKNTKHITNVVVVHELSNHQIYINVNSVIKGPSIKPEDNFLSIDLSLNRTEPNKYDAIISFLSKNSKDIESNPTEDYRKHIFIVKDPIALRKIIDIARDNVPLPARWEYPVMTYRLDS